ncbi:MAG: hypothetical protein ACI8QZ_001479 [Chlamydiales bacterium]|jgi:hypothetical protein
MRRAWLVVRFAALTGLFAWILLSPLSGLGNAYGRALRGTANAAVQGVGSNFEVRIKTRKAGHSMDSAIIVRPDGRHATRFPFSSRNRGYLPTVCGIALALATPIVWRRRLRAALLTALLTQVFVGARLALSIIQMLQARPRINADLPSILSTPASHELFQRLTSVEREASLFFLVPLGIWAVVTLRMDDIERIWNTVPAE